MRIDRQEIKDESKKIVGLIFGSLIYSAGINLFVVPSNLYMSGLLGWCQLIRTLLEECLHLSSLNFDIAGIIYYLINIPILLIAIMKVGKKFLLKTLIALTSSTVFLTVIPIVAIVQDRLTACVIGGIMAGVGLGLCLRMGCTFGGIDVIGVMITCQKNNFSVGKLNLIVNFILYCVCVFIFDIEVVIYSLIFAAIYAVSADKIHIQNINVEVKVVTKANVESLQREVLHKLGRGMTKWIAEGVYTKEDASILYILLSKYEVARLKVIIHKHDPNAFVVINEGVSVDGNYIKRL